VSLPAILTLLLALSVAGNAWQYHEHDKAVAAVATAEQLGVDTKAAAQACGASVDALAADSKARSARIEQQLAGWSGRILELPGASLEALSARPANPADLCGSVTQYLQAQIRKGAPGAKP